MAVQSLLTIIALSLLSTTLVAGQADQAMQADVRRMVRASHTVGTLQPWALRVPEVDAVVRHGTTVVPQLLRLLPDDPDNPDLFYEEWDERAIVEGKIFDWRVQQDAAIALCGIYRIRIQDCPMYSNRASREQNRRIRPFFLKKAAQGK